MSEYFYHPELNERVNKQSLYNIYGFMAEEVMAGILDNKRVCDWVPLDMTHPSYDSRIYGLRDNGTIYDPDNVFAKVDWEIVRLPREALLARVKTAFDNKLTAVMSTERLFKSDDMEIYWVLDPVNMMHAAMFTQMFGETDRMVIRGDTFGANRKTEPVFVTFNFLSELLNEMQPVFERFWWFADYLRNRYKELQEASEEELETKALAFLAFDFED